MENNIRTNAKAKHWTATINNYDDGDIRMFTHIEELATYYVYGKETGDSGTKHLQCYITFKKPTSLNQLKRIWPKGHFEIKFQKSTPQQTSNYCKKDGEYMEWGILPESKSTNGGEATKQKWIQMKTAAQESRLDDIPAKEFIIYYKTFKQISFDYQKTPTNLDKLNNEWIVGPPGVGKSYTARSENLSLYIKMCNKWWDNYENEDAVLLDDFDLLHNVLGHHLKIWADRYPFRAEIKGHTRIIRPRKVIVTSNYMPEEIWPNDKVLVEALNRRFTIRRMVKLNISDNTISKKRKLPPLKILVKKPALFRQNANGDIVVNNNKQPTLDELVEAAETAEPITIESESSIEISIEDSNESSEDETSSDEERRILSEYEDITSSSESEDNLPVKRVKK